MIQKPNIIQIILAVIITAAVVGGGMYYFQNIKQQTEKENLSQPVEENSNKSAKGEKPAIESESKQPLFFDYFLEPVAAVKMASVTSFGYSEFDSHNLQFLVKNECQKWWKFKKVSSSYSTVELEVTGSDSSENSMTNVYAILTKSQLDFALKEKTTKDIGTAEWDPSLYLWNYKEVVPGYYLIRSGGQSEVEIPANCLFNIEVTN